MERRGCYFLNLNKNIMYTCIFIYIISCTFFQHMIQKALLPQQIFAIDAHQPQFRVLEVNLLRSTLYTVVLRSRLIDRGKLELLAFQYASIEQK
jgi:hypothetical protein